VIIKVDAATRQFTLVVGRPPVAALLLKEIGKEKGSGKSKTETIGDVSLDAVTQIAQAKGADLQGRTDDHRINQVIGTCVSMGITVDGQDPRALLKARTGGVAA
jgi:large subunit ribosomal protein L11